VFLYFSPNRFTKIPPELQYAFDESGSFTRVETVSGPLGAGAGVILANAASVPSDRVRLDPANQTWRRIPKTDFLCGRWNDSVITPSTIQRDTLHEGHPIELEDGSRWQCAISRGFDAERLSYYSPLPRSLALNDDGIWLPSEFAPQYRRFAQLAFEYADAYEAALSSDQQTFQFASIDELAILGLTINYRISAIELALMPDAYSIRARQQMIGAILDFPTIQEWGKKKIGSGADGSGTVVGQTQ
jgi:hypothetical protein